MMWVIYALCIGMPGTMQKELAQSDHPAQQHAKLLTKLGQIDAHLRANNQIH
jgi:hypothetical protein